MSNSKTARIIGWGSYLPERVVTNDDLSKVLETTDEWISTRTGIRQRHIAADNEISSDLATFAARRAIERAGINAEDIDMIILSTVCPDNTFPATAARVQANLGIKRGPAFDIGAACAGFVYALSIANNTILTGNAKNVLVIGVEIFSRLIDWSDRRSAVLFGDGAGAVVLQAHENKPGEAMRGIIGYEIHTDGSFYDILRTDGGPSTTQTIGKLMMDGKEVYRQAVVKLAEVGQSLLDKHNVTVDQLDWVIPHQANIRIIQSTGERLGIPEEKTVITVDKHANTSAASIPLALDTMAHNIQPGQLVLLEALGAGLVWGALLMRW